MTRYGSSVGNVLSFVTLMLQTGWPRREVNLVTGLVWPWYTLAERF